MRELSRRTVLGQVGIAVGAALGIGSVRASHTDPIEEIESVLRNLQEEVQNAEDVLEGLDPDGFGGDTDFDGGTGIGGFDGDPDFDGGTGIDGFDGDPEFDDGADFGGDSSSDGLDLDEIDDDLTINGVPVGEAESADQLNQTSLSQFDGEIRVNGIPLGNATGEETQSESGSQSDSEAIDAQETANRSDGSGGESTEDSGFSGFDGDPGSDVDNSTETDTEEPATGESQPLVPDSLLEDARDVIEDVREEYQEVREEVQEVSDQDQISVIAEVQSTNRLLDDIGAKLDTAEQNLDTGFEQAAETMEAIDEMIDDHLGGVNHVGGGGFLDGI
jgi:hypothetical protein